MIPAISGAIGPLGPAEWNIGGTAAPGLGGSGLEAVSGTSAVGADPSALSTAPVSGTGSFGDSLTQAIGSLENTQSNATTAAQGLATGTVTDPTQAVTAVENASLAMDYAAQLRNKLTDAATTIFQTQV